MRKLLSGMVIMAMFSQVAHAQAPLSTTLFTIGDEKVSSEEFVKVYQKTNISGEADFSEQSLRDYLELYVNFRLKVKEAKDMKMDTTSAVLNEFKTYRGKLTPSYMYDTSLMREAYRRMQTDLHVNHVLLKVDQNASPADTLKAYKRILNWRKMITSGKADFNTLAADSSSDPSAKENRGDLGWISTMQLIYPFETVAYGLKQGTVSSPVRTSFGYHLVKVIDARPSQGTVTAAHLFMKVPQKATEEDQLKAKSKIDSLYQVLRSGGNWDELVKGFSQDKTSSANGGQLKPFGTGQMVAEFEQAAFALQKPGDISAPVKTKFGWHIIKLIEKKPLGSYESMKDELKKKIEGGPWKDYSKQSFINKLKKDYQFKEMAAAKNALFAKIDSPILKGLWNDSLVNKMKDPVFTLTDAKWVPETKSFTQADLADYIEKNQRKFMNKGSKAAMLNSLYDQFVATGITNFEDARLEAKYPPFHDLMEEYMNGILLFDLASDKVWTKAVEDTAGLQAFYEQNKNNYMGQEKAAVKTYTAKNKEVADLLAKYQAKGMGDEALLNKINKKDKSNLVIAMDTFEKGKNSEIEKLGWGAAGQSYTVTSDSSIRLLRIESVLPPAPRPLNEVKGYVVADYQEFLEKKWIAELRQKYPVSINEQVFRSLIKS